MRIPSSMLLVTASISVSALLVSGCGGNSKPAETPATETNGADEKNDKGETDAKDTKDEGKASPFSVPSVNGTGKAELKPGKVTIVDFWATWCEPCKKSFPKLQELYVKYKDSGLEIVAISVDDEKSGLAAFAQAHGAKFPVGWDEGQKIAGKWKPAAMPSTFVVDKQGNIKHVHKGYHDGEEKELEKEIKDLL